ncbi:hypothetical protein ACA910_010761 [Epithemia clementina (nom. ined.)]
MAKATASSSVDSSLLDRQHFLCQNSATGEIMQNRWTLRQLCRILCPPSASPLSSSNQNTNVNSEATTTSTPPLASPHPTTFMNKVVSPESQLLAIEADGSYSREGWKPAKECNVLKEAVALWYYQTCCAPHDPSSSQKEALDSATEGPLSCRQLANLLEENKLPLNEETRVYSDATRVWDSISKFPNLQLALYAFQGIHYSHIETTAAASNGNPSQTGMNLFDMAYPSDKDIVGNPRDTNDKNVSKESIRDELEAFLSSTARDLAIEKTNRESIDNDDGGDDDDDDDNESYESDGGTRFTKNVESGEWVHEEPSQMKLPTSGATQKRKSVKPIAAPNNQEALSSQKSDLSTQKSKKRKRSKFSAKHAKCWIYINGLPEDCTSDELQEVFSKAGIIDLDPESQLPKIKIYRHRDGPNKGQAKGDASICYARPESVELALTLFDETTLRPAFVVGTKNVPTKMSVQPAKFEQHGESFDASKGAKRVSNVKRQVAKLAAIQATDWDEGEFNGRITGGRKGLRIIVIKHLFDPMAETMDDTKLQSLERDLTAECAKYGDVEKMTVFEKNPEGVVVVKFTKPGAASEAVRALNGREWNKGSGSGTTTTQAKRLLRVIYWDGVTDYTVRDNEEKELIEMVKRQEEFGDWLEKQELPEELRLKSESHAEENN